MEAADQIPSDESEPAAFAEGQGPAGSTTTVSAGSTARSYGCTFCKRGFSNAQALGGHMNIHRKDRARLNKRPAGPNHAHFPFDIAGPNAIPSRHTIFDSSWISTASRSRPSSPTQMPLFVDAPSMLSHRHDGPSVRDIEHGGEELDLELRLGPEQPEGRRRWG